jgi:long-chain fatty acid transport protein
MRRFLFSLTMTLATASLSYPQTNDHLYRSWRWEEDLSAPRPAGLAGAFVGLANDSSSMTSNPAGLATLPGGEIAGSALWRGSGMLGPGDSLASASGLGYLAGARRFGSLAFGAFYSEPRDAQIAINPIALPDHTHDQGSLDATVKNFGGSIAYHVSPRLRLGGSIVGTRLELNGTDSREFRRGPDLEHIDAGAEDTAIRVMVGALYDWSDRLRLGLTARTGGTWDVSRDAWVLRPTLVIDPGSVYEFRSPDVYSAGASYRVLDRLLLSGQLDYVRYSRISSGLTQAVGNPAGVYTLDDAFEPRVGAEWWHPFRTVELQLRGGVYGEANNALKYVGGNPTEAATFPGVERRLVGAVGTSIAVIRGAARGLAFDTGYVFGGDHDVFVAGARLSR